MIILSKIWYYTSTTPIYPVKTMFSLLGRHGQGHTGENTTPARLYRPILAIVIKLFSNCVVSIPLSLTSQQELLHGQLPQGCLGLSSILFIEVDRIDGIGLFTHANRLPPIVKQSLKKA